MQDFIIRQLNSSEFGVTAQTKGAENRKPSGVKVGHTLVFKGIEDIINYVTGAEAEGLTFENKAILAA